MQYSGCILYGRWADREFSACLIACSSVWIAHCCAYWRTNKACNAQCSMYINKPPNPSQPASQLTMIKQKIKHHHHHHHETITSVSSTPTLVLYRLRRYGWFFTLRFFYCIDVFFSRIVEIHLVLLWLHLVLCEFQSFLNSYSKHLTHTH